MSNKMKTKKYYIVGTVPKIIERGKIDTPNTHTYDKVI